MSKLNKPHLPKSVEKISETPDSKKLDDYVKRIVKAVNYKGDKDTEDVISILKEFRASELVREREKKEKCNCPCEACKGHYD